MDNEEGIKIDNIQKYFSINIKKVLYSQNKELLDCAYEIRIRLGIPVYLKTTRGNYFLSNSKNSTKIEDDFYLVTKGDITSTMSLLTSNSMHAFEKEMENGYVTIEGGHRVGIGGNCIYEGDKFKGFKYITSLNVRIAKEFVGCSFNVLKYIVMSNTSIYNSLIVGPPMSGKTTCVRDVARSLSEGFSVPKFYGCEVTIIDERGEITAIYNGEPQMKVGNRTDILAYCKKRDGFGISIRALSPAIIVSDELGLQEDYETLQYAMKSGVKIVSTAHSSNIKELKDNIYLRRIVEGGFIERIIFLDGKKPGKVNSVYDNINRRVIYENFN